jgi:hypothetical protein
MVIFRSIHFGRSGRRIECPVKIAFANELRCLKRGPDIKKP